MVFMHRLILGVLLIFLSTVKTAEVQKKLADLQNKKELSSNSSTLNENETLNSENETKAKISDVDIENIVKPFKFLRTSPRNVTTLKLKKSESYTTTTTTTQKYPEGSRNGSGRSVDIDIEKYISPDFYNAVYTSRSSEEDKKTSSEGEPRSDYITEKDNNSRETIFGQLTTPKTPYFDKKYKETVESVNQKLEAETSSERDNNGTNSFNHTSDNFITEVEEHTNGTKLTYKDYHNLELNETADQRSYHSDVVRERKKILNFENVRNESKTYEEKKPIDESNELLKENVKYLLGDENEVEKEENIPKTSSDFVANRFTTRRYSIIKPSTDKNDLFSNKIESETIKTNITEATSFKPNTTRRGSIKFADYQNNNKNKTSLEPIVQENQIVPVQATPPSANYETTTNKNTETTIKFDATTSNNETKTTVEKLTNNENITEPDEQQSTTVLIFVRPDDALLETTTQEEYIGTTLALPRGFRLDTTTSKENNEPTEYVIESETITDKTDETFEEYTTEIPEHTTPNQEIQTQFDVMYKDTPDQETTLSTTTEIDTTTSLKETRFSKEFKMEETTTIPETTTNVPNIQETTTITSELEETTITNKSSNDESTTQLGKLRQITTESVKTTTTQEIQITTLLISNGVTPEDVTQTLLVPDETTTETLIQNRTVVENSPVEEANTTTPTTSINFVHIKNIDRNHTTLLPDILKPNEIYTTPNAVSMETNMRTATTEATTHTDDTTSHAADLDGPSGSGATIAIVISCIGGICLIALACLLVVMRNRQKRFNYGQRCRPVSLDDYSVDNVSVFNSVRRKANARASKRSYGNPAFEDPVCLSHPLTFPAISKFASNLEDVTSEFAEIPQIIARTSELPEGCEIKNRYANVIPLPESRVYLNNLEGYSNSDYINANFVTGPKNTRKYYIACQGPMSNTVDDFWRMIWEQQCKVILMLTHLFENGVEKCFDYLPPSEVLDCHRLFGDFQITLKKREVKEKYIISSIQLKNMVSNSWREVTHFWYMGWPEKGVPNEANSIIAFLIEARSYMKSGTIDKKSTLNQTNGTNYQQQEINPVVVHCSPGTGRTGVVITCDIAIREFEQTRQVDIPKIVYRIRRDRASAVQTKDQYAFIYKVINLYATKLAGGSLESI